MQEKNTIFVVGIVDTFEESHKYTNNVTNKESIFYKALMKNPRLSGNIDYIPVIIPDKLLINNQIKIGDVVSVTGIVRTRDYTDYNSNTNHLAVYVYATDIETENPSYSLENKNFVELEGYLCKKPKLFINPMQRNIIKNMYLYIVGYSGSS